MFYLDADKFLALPLFPDVESFINNYPTIIITKQHILRIYIMKK
jgi:hypothetical protein